MAEAVSTEPSTKTQNKAVKKEQKASWASYKKLLLIYLGPQWKRALIMAVLLLMTINFQLISPQILRSFIDTALAGSDVPSLLLIGALYVGIAIVEQAVGVYNTYIGSNVAWTATNRLRTTLVAHCLTLDSAFHKEHTPGEMIERLDSDVNTLSHFFSYAFTALFGNALLIVGIIAILFHEDWRLGLFMSGFALIALILLLSLRNIAVAQWEAERQKNAEFFGFLGEQLTGTEDIRANGATRYVMRRFHRLLRAWYPVSRRASLAGYTIWLSSMLLFGIGSMLALALGAYLWSIDAISIGTIYLIFSYTNLLEQPLQQIRNQLEGLQKAGAGVVRVERLLSTKPTITDGSDKSLPAGALSVEFDRVSFGYNQDDTILHHLTFDLKPGRVLGILGRTGSGKTTLARLLLRLYDVQEGEVRIGGIPVRGARVRDLRQHIGYVTQEVQLFHATVRDNLTFFNPEIADERIMEVLKDLGLMRWYKSLPKGLDTELGSEGEGLSAGEAQLLAFARVFLANPGLVILDEASSRLDPATEQLIERAMNRLLEGRTAIIIAHRLGTIQRADEIMIIDDGRIIEHGERVGLAKQSDSRFSHLLTTGLEEVLA